MGGTDLLIRFIGLDLVSRVAERAGNSVDRLQNRINRSGIASAQSFIAAGIAMTTAGVSVLALAAGLTYLAGTSIEAAAQFRSDMVMVVTHAKLAADQIDVVSKALMDMAPAVGFGPDALAQAFYHVQSATSSLYTDGLPHTTEKLEILRQAAELAAVGHADLTATTNTLISVLAAYHDKNLSAADAAAQLNSIVGFGNVTLSQFDAAMRGGLLPIAAQTGITIASLGAAFGVLTDEGYGASQAATYLRSAIIQMSMPSGPAAKALEAIGLSGEKVAKQMGYFNEVLAKAGINQTELANELSKSGSLSQTLDMLRQKLIAAGLSGQQASALIERSFGGIRSGAGVVGLMDNLTSLAAKEKGIAQSTSEWAATWKYFQSNDPAFVIKQMQAAFDVLRITIGNALMPTFLRLANTILPFLTRIRDWINAHQELFAKLVVGAIAVGTVIGALLVAAGGILIIGGALGVVASSIGPILGVLGGLAAASGLGAVFAGIVEFVTAIATLGPGAILAFAGSLGPLGIALVAILAIITAVVLVVQHWGQIVHGVTAFITTFHMEMQRGATAGFALTMALEAMGMPMRAAQTIGNALNIVIRVLVSAWENLSRAVVKLIGDFINQLQSTGQLKEVMSQLGDLWREAAPLVEILGAVIGVVLVAALGLAIGFLKGFVEMLSVVIPAAILIVVGVLRVVMGVINLFVDLWRGNWSNLGRDIQDITQGFCDIVEGLVIGIFGGIFAFLHGFVTGVVGFFQWLYDTLVGHSIIPDLVNSIVNWFTGLPGRISGALLSGLGAVAGAAARLGDAIFNGLTSRLAGLGAWIRGMVGGAMGSVGIPSAAVGGGNDNIGYGAEGAIVNRPTLALIGEAGPEALVPLNRAGANRPLPNNSGSGGTDDEAVALLRQILTVLTDTRRDGKSNSRLPAGSDNSNLLSSVAQALAEKGARGRRAGMRAVYA